MQLIRWPARRRQARGQGRVEIGAHEAFEPGARLPAKVDAVIETVGAAARSRRRRREDWCQETIPRRSHAGSARQFPFAHEPVFLMMRAEGKTGVQR